MASVIHVSEPDADGYSTYTLDGPLYGDFNNGESWIRLNGQTSFQLHGTGPLDEGQPVTDG